MDSRIRPWTPDEQTSVLKAVERAFLSDYDAEAEEPLGMLDHARTLSVWDGGAPVATAASFALQMAVPGTLAPVAGVTFVSVQPTHRRQGMLTALMTRQLDDLRAGGEAVAALWASEPAIYGRYGYGLASRSVKVSLSRGDALRPGVPAGGVREAVPADVVPQLRAVWDRSFPDRPGQFAKDEPWWEHRLFDPPRARDGGTALRCALLDDGTGYVLFSAKNGWHARGPAGSVTVRELVATSGASSLRLWQFVLGLDLVAEWTARFVALDDTLFGGVVDARRLAPQVHDGLYVRLVRLGEALESRRYAADVDVVLDVTDDRLPDNAGRWRLQAGPDGATCERTDADPDLGLAVEALGSAFLGGTTLSSLAAAGRVHELRAGALVAASRAFRGDVEPLCSHVF
jgi:predicted acetyltransferase